MQLILRMSGRQPNTKLFQTSPVIEEEMRAPMYLIVFLDYSLRMYKHRCEIMSADHLKILYSVPKESRHRKQRSCVSYSRTIY